MAVYKRGAKGVFYMNFTVGGVRVTRSTGKFTKKEAKLVEAVEKKRMMVDGALSPREKRARMKFSEAIKKVYDERWKNNKDGLKSYRIMELVMDLIGDQPISKIDEDIVAHLVLMMEGKGNKPATINRSLAGLKTVLKYHKQPWDHIKLKKESKGRIRVLSKEEEMTVIDQLRNQDHTNKMSYFPEVADMVEVLVDTGCRLSEVLNLKYEDINFVANLITIWINKGDKPRSIPMTERVRTILERRRANGAVKPFTITRDQAERAWSWTRKRMGLAGDPEFVLHALRHTTATRLIDKGIDLYTVKEWLGHSTIQVTERYAHLNPEKLVHAATVLEP
jgi:Site-specific recombinase XerD